MVATKKKKAQQKVVVGWFGGEYVSVLKKTKFFSLVLSYNIMELVLFIIFSFHFISFFLKIVCYIYF